MKMKVNKTAASVKAAKQMKTGGASKPAKIGTTYRSNPEVYDAGVFGARHTDLKPGPGLKPGVIVDVEQGYNLVMSPISGLTGKIVAFKPNGKCEFDGDECPCMYKKGQNYGVALYCKKLVQVEFKRFKKQNEKARAILLS